jgi:hypothetical protein
MSSAIQSHQDSTQRGWAGDCRTSRWAFEQADNRQIQSWFGGGLPTPPDTRDMTEVALNRQADDTRSTLSYQPSRLPFHDVSNTDFAAQFRSNSYSHASSRTQIDLPESGMRTRGSREPSYASQDISEKDDEIATYLQIPPSVNQSKGSLAEFAAEITCLFWFEGAATLQYAETTDNYISWERGLVPDAIPSTGFRKWVTTILTTTQVSKEVILLALMFIYRLKKFNPSVSGKRGSEFRLLTIALMLGNKFLDDNTYTNKTWAEVSGISVMEIHIMEVEFLSNMRYDLYVSKEEWKSWNTLLGKFGQFYERASRPSRTDSRSSAPVTPISQTFPHKLPSPPATYHGQSTYASHGYAPTLPNPLTAVAHPSRSPVRQQRNPVLEQLERKRSMDFATDLPPAKRFHQATYPASNQIPPTITPTTTVYTPNTLPALTPDSFRMGSNQPSNQSSSSIQLPRLPMPRIDSTRNSSSAHLAPLSLPASRAMSTVYAHGPMVSSQPITPISAGPTDGLNLYHNPIPPLSDGGRQHSNYASANGSPATLGYNAVRPGLSPSYFLTNRSSPYRPVRGVNTLLIPPPSASMQNPARNMAHDQIHYQPLSKAGTERRSGPLPYMATNNSWYQSNQTTPQMPQRYQT